jgi:hypothetical protein
MVSHVDIIGALIYRTRQALNKKVAGETHTSFYLNAIYNYKYANMIFDNEDVMHLWHIVGTQNEIQNYFETIAKDERSGSKLFPCILNYQSVVETHGVGKDGLTQFDYDLSIACPVDSAWTTEQRNRKVHKYILEPIYNEFMKQLLTCGWFQIPMEGLDFTRMKVFTTGTSLHKNIRAQYGWYVDLIQITDLHPLLKRNLCQDDVDTIEREAELVTDSI